MCGHCRVGIIIETPELREAQEQMPLLPKSEVGVSPVAFPRFRLCVLPLYGVVLRARRDDSARLFRSWGVCSELIAKETDPEKMWAAAGLACALLACFA